MESVGEVKLVRLCALCGAPVYTQRTGRFVPICRDCWKEAFLDGEEARDGEEEARPPPSGEGGLPVQVLTLLGLLKNSPPGGASR